MKPMNRKTLVCCAFLLIGTLSALFGDGFIVVPEPFDPVSMNTGPFPLEVKYHHVAVKIMDRTAVTSIDQVFFNPGRRVLEGEYIFPVPKGAVIKNFSMYIDGKETPAELMDAVKARAIYEEIVRKTLDPALLEYQGSNIFRVRIFPIEPQKEKRVKISYSEIIGKEGSTYEYVYPLNTEKFSAKPLASALITVNLECTNAIKNIFSTTHGIDTVRKNEKKAVASWEAHDVKPDTDFKLYFTLAESEFGVSLLPYREKGDIGFFFLDISPGFWQPGKVKIPKDVTFVLDVSGSMAGQKLEKAKNAILYCLAQLEADDRFALVRFSTEADMLFNTVVAADSRHLKEARDYINNLIAVGGTNIEEALTLALSLNSGTPDDNRVKLIVFITDGKPTIGETDSDKLVAKLSKGNKQNLRIFTVGIDFSLNTILLDKITTLTRAWRTYISPKEDIEAKISSFYQKLAAPVLAHISLRTSDNIQLTTTHPRLNELPDLFLGTSLTLLGRYRGSGRATIALKGVVGRETKEFTYELDFPEEEKKYDSIPPLWASRRVGYLLEQIRLYGESRELVDEITSLARSYGIITPYTSYLILEDEAARVTRNELRPRDQTLRNVAPPESGFEEKSKSEFFNLKEDSGTGGVTASDEIQSLRSAQSNDVAKSASPRLNVYDREGREIDIQSQVKTINGRAFYNAGSEWNDSYIQSQKADKVNRIQFASKEYFDLIKKKPESNAYLALGKNLRFMLDNELYEIFE